MFEKTIQIHRNNWQREPVIVNIDTVELTANITTNSPDGYMGSLTGTTKAGTLAKLDQFCYNRCCTAVLTVGVPEAGFREKQPKVVGVIFMGKVQLMPGVHYLGGSTLLVIEGQLGTPVDYPVSF
jgi:hypothetical protein